MTTSTDATRRPHWGRRVALAFLALVVLILIAAAWVGVRGLMAKAELDAVVSLTQPVRDAAESRDLDRLDELVTEVESHATQAASLTGDPIWRLAEVLPFAGPNLAAVRTVSSAVADVAGSAQPLLGLARDAAASGDTGSVMRVLADARSPLQTASDAFADADAALAALQSDALLPPVTAGVEKASVFVQDGGPMVASLAQAAQILPPMLGADGPRTLLVMIQNGAELRTAGGLAGSFVLLQADADGFDIVEQADSSKFPRRTEPIAEVPASTTAFYGDDVARYVQNATMTPDFATTGSLVSSWWAGYTGTAPDAVLSIDLATVASLVEVSGPLVLPDGTEIPADELEQRVLVDPYFTLDSDEQTAFQELVTAAAMERILGSSGDPAAWIGALVAPVEQGRISAWSSVESEQATIVSSMLGGPAARHAASGDAYAVYFNDATGGKMDGFMDVSIATGSASCRPDGRHDVTVAVTLTNTAPADAGAWPMLVTGGGSQGVTPGDISTDVAVAAPAGTFLGEVLRDGEAVLPADAEIAGFPMIRAGVLVSPGQSSTIEFHFVTAGAADPSLSVLHTPLLNTPEVTTTEVRCA
ncbi:DUF4012 domain-containing protein [Planococcus sp. APC 4015]|nr:DUF4012 domain-containing protein [Planococcus sp. APC 4015]